MAKQGKSSKKQDTTEQSNRRDSAWTRGKERAKARNEEQLAAAERNKRNYPEPKPWEKVCKERSQSPDRVKKRMYWLRTNQLPEKR